MYTPTKTLRTQTKPLSRYASPRRHHLLSGLLIAATIAASLSAGASSVWAEDPSITLTLDYIGSTTGNASGAGATYLKMAQNAGTGLKVNIDIPGSVIPTNSVTVYTPTQLCSATAQSIPGLKNYFGVYLDFSTADITNQRICAVKFSVTYPAGMTPISSTGQTDTTTSNKFLFYNPTDDNTGSSTWNTIYPANFGDLNGVGVLQDPFTNAYSTFIGTSQATKGESSLGIFPDAAGYVSGKGTLIGLFALEFTNNSRVIQGTVDVTPWAGCTAWYTDPNSIDGSPVYVDSAFHSIPYVIATPEPTSLAAFGLSALALLMRRHIRNG